MKTLVLAAILALAASPVLAKDGSGSFTSFKNYKVSGKATVKGTKLTLSGFNTTDGPDLYVYVGNGSPSKRIGKLKANSGNQSYTVPAGNFSSVFIHCKRFNSTFGQARLK
jgi:hypothetical protein